MNISITKDGWVFRSESLNEILGVVKDQFLYNIESIEALLFGKEKFVLLKSVVDNDVDEIDDFYRTNLMFGKNVIGSLDSSIDVNIKKTEIYLGAGIYKDGSNWNLFIPLDI